MACEEPSVTDWIQAGSVPLSIFLTWLVFKLGLKSESKKFTREKRFESIEKGLDRLECVEKALQVYLDSGQNNSDIEKQNFFETLRKFAVTLNRIAPLCTDSYKELSDLNFEFHNVSTGHKYFMDNSKLTPAEKSQIIRDSGVVLKRMNEVYERLREQFLSQ